MTAYASVSRFRIDDLHPYIYRTHDGGKSWQPIVAGLPDSPVDTVREDPVHKGLLFAGTETSVWASFDDGDHWQSLQLNLPRTSMRDLWVQGNDLIVGTHGRSFWILDNISRLRELNAAAAAKSANLFRPAVAFRVKRSTYPDTPLPPDEPTAKNPPDGAVIEYSLGQQASGAITLEVLDPAGKLVRRISSTDKPDVTQSQLEKQHIPLYWMREAKTLATSEGAHRWVWNLHYPSPVSAQHEFPIAAVPHDTPRNPLGPTALPGQYTVKLTVNGQSSSAPLTVKLDPRVKTPLAALQQKLALETRLANALSRSSEAVLQAKSVRGQIKKLSTQANGSASESLKTLDAKLAAFLDGPEKPPPTSTRGAKDVNGDIYSLYGAASGNDSVAKDADAAPTVALVNAASKAESELAPIQKAWEQIKPEITVLNQQLKGANLPELRLEIEAGADDSGVDRE
jgi:hypothetical protein